MKRIGLMLLFLLNVNLSSYPESVTTLTILLNQTQQESLHQLVNTDPKARQLWQQLKQEADLVLRIGAQPIDKMKYSGFSAMNDERIETEIALFDMDCLAVLFYAIICSGHDSVYINKARLFILSWARTYVPTGNPGNEVMLESLFHCYFLIRKYFSITEQEEVEDWLIEIADKERKNDNLPMDKNEAQRIKTMGTLGYILNDPDLVKYAIGALKKFIEVSLYPDGTSYDLSETDRLGDHISMLESLVTFGITFRQFEGPETQFDVYLYESPNGSSVKKCVEYVKPYANGNKKRLEKCDTELEIEGTMSGEYTSARSTSEWFNPSTSKMLMELVSFFHKDTIRVLNGNIASKEDYKSWLEIIIGLSAVQLSI